MTCKEVADFIVDYVAGELSPEVREVFDAHLRVCPNCREYLALYGTTMALERTAFDNANDAVDTGIPEELVAAILASRPRRR